MIETAKPAFTSEDLGAAFRPIPAMAVVSLLLGTLSLVAFAGGPMNPCDRLFAPALAPAWYLAPVAAFVAWRTSRRLESARLEYSGQLLAKIGLLLALVALVCAPLRYYTKRVLLARESRAVADEFLDSILEHRVDDGYRLMSPAYVQSQSIEEIVNRQGREAYQKYRELPIVAGLKGRAQEVQITHLDEIYGDTQNRADEIFHRYVVSIDRKGGPPDKLLAVIGLVGAVSQDGRWDGRVWTVTPQTSINSAGPEIGDRK